MPRTHFPNGVSARASSAASSNAGAGDIDGANIYGEVIAMNFTLASASGAQVSEYWAVPFNGEVVSASVVVGATVTVTTGHSFILNSAGNTIITVTPTSGVAWAATQSTAVDNATVSVGDTIHVSRAVQGTAGNTNAQIVIKRT